MWNDSLKAWYRRNRRLIQGSFNAGSASFFLISVGSVLTTLDPLERVILALAIGVLVSLIFGLWTVRSTPRYPQTPLEHHQERIERAVLKEWGAANNWLRETIAAAEEFSEKIIEIYRETITDNEENTLREIVLLTMHNRTCELARAVADLCQRGHAEAAFIIWRSIFELEVNMGYISQDATGGRAERFVDWGEAAYLRLNAPNSTELKSLEAKYPRPQRLDREIGWTREKNPIGIPGRAKEIGYPTKRQANRIPVLDMYEESSAYSHNDAMALLNNLGNGTPFRKGPSVSGHDMPLCLTARSLTTVTHTLANCQEEAHRSQLDREVNIVGARSSQIPLEVAMVPRRLLSRFGGFDMTIEWETEDGRLFTAKPYRRESEPEDFYPEQTDLHSQNVPLTDNDDP